MFSLDSASSLSIKRLACSSALLVSGAIACAPSAAFAGNGLQSAGECRLDATDRAAVEQVAEFAASACRGTDTPEQMQACSNAQARWHDVRQSYCATDPCTLDITSIPVSRTRVAARSIEDFLAYAATASAGGEIGSFHWSVDAQPTGPGQRVVKLVAGGDLVLPSSNDTSATGDDDRLIRKAIRMVEAHEDRHRDRFLQVARKACAEMNLRVGDTNDILQKYFCATGPGSNAAAQHDVDMADGITRLVVSEDGTRDVRGEGADYDVRSYVTAGMCK